MVDTLSRAKRSWLMSRVKSNNTKPEKVVRSIVHRMGFRFRLHQRIGKGRPDIILRRHRKIIFVHGCFWHQHKGCRASAKPTSNVSFWNLKLEDNIKRDKKTLGALKREGWQILILWECEIKKPVLLLRKINRFLLK